MPSVERKSMQKTRLWEKYQKEVKPALAKEFRIRNPLAAPRVNKVVINAGVGEAAKNAQNLENLKKSLATITGQVPSVRAAKVSVASFGVRAGMPVGLLVTLRGARMYSFLDRLFSLVLPRLRDFRGLPFKSFDGHGGYSLGIADLSVFPEIDLSKSYLSHGIEITIVTTAKDNKQAKRLLELLGCQFEH